MKTPLLDTEEFFCGITDKEIGICKIIVGDGCPYGYIGKSEVKFTSLVW